ncbi:hypothetical protein BH23VER1_BH23VER1_18990 [soil metagenome]
MRNYRPLLIQDLGISMPGIEVLKLRLNQHTPEAVWSRHAHEHEQLLLYLSGRGFQEVGGKTFAARAGTVIVVPAGQEHAFQRAQQRQPLCLVLDLRLKESRWPVHACTQLSAGDLSDVRGELSKLFRVREIEQREMMFQVGAAVMHVLHVALRTAGWLRPINRYGDNRRLGATRAAQRALDRSRGEPVSLAEIARRVGYQQDHLNRLLKSECGLTLGQLQSRMQVLQVQQLLSQPDLAIFEVAERAGFHDHNYFSRWYRQQTGVTPSAWRKNPVRAEPI